MYRRIRGHRVYSMICSFMPATNCVSSAQASIWLCNFWTQITPSCIRLTVFCSVHSAPCVYSLKKAMQTYRRQGRTSSIFVHEDGMQLLSEEERQAWIVFYTDHSVGWVVRPTAQWRTRRVQTCGCGSFQEAVEHQLRPHALPQAREISDGP